MGRVDGRKSRRSAIRILVGIDLRDDRGTISRANRSRSDPPARNVERIERRTSEARKRFTIRRIPVPEIVILPKHRGKNSRKSRRVKRKAEIFCNNKPSRAKKRKTALSANLSPRFTINGRLFGPISFRSS